MSAILTQAIDAWRRTKHPRFAAIADWASRAARARPPVGVSGKASDVAAWDEVFARRDALDLPRLFDTLAAAKSKLAAERLTRFSTWEDPRVVSRVLEMLEDPPFRAGTAMQFFRAAASVLAEANDARVKPALEDLSGRYKTILETSIGDTVTALLLRTVRSLKEAPVSALSADDEALALALEAGFEDEKRSQARAATSRQVNTSSDDALLAAIYEHPEDDAPREVFADALLERGDVRGEFIRLQLLHARGEVTRETALRERELLRDRKRAAAFGHPLSSGADCRLHRGFPDRLTWLPTPKLLLGQPALRTVRAVDALTMLSMKMAKALLLHEHAQHVRRVQPLEQRLFNALPDALPWSDVTLVFPPTARDLDRLPSLTRLCVGPIPGIAPLTEPLSPAVETFITTHPLGAGVLASLTGVRTLHLCDWKGPARTELPSLPRLTALSTHDFREPRDVQGLKLTSFKTECAGDGVTVTSLLDALPRLQALTITRRPAPDLVKQLAGAGETAKRLSRFCSRYFTLAHPFTPQAKLTLHPGFPHASHVPELAEALRVLPEGCVTHVELRPEPVPLFNALPPPPEGALTTLQRANPALRVSLEWY